MKTETTFLDYEITAIHPTDGYVLWKHNASGKNLWECHLGNYATIKAAKKATVHYFMIARPHEFSNQILRRMNGSYTYHDYFKFIGVLKNEKIECPPEIGSTDDFNFILCYDNKKI